MKKWEILKACKNVIDDQDEILKGISVKEKLKENVTWKIQRVENEECPIHELDRNWFERKQEGTV